MATFSHRQPPRTPFQPPAPPNTTHAAIPSSSPAFATPVHPIRPPPPPRPLLDLQTANANPASSPSPLSAPPPILPILLPPATLRPLAFRTFTKKHSVTLTTSALGALATFIGRHCGAGWREDGLAEPVLEEVARMWKRGGGSGDGGGGGAGMGDVIVDGESQALKTILKQLEGCMSGGRIVIARSGGTLSRQVSLVGGDALGLQRQESFGVSATEHDEEDDIAAGEALDARRWLKVVDAFEQPRMIYNAAKKHFEKSKSTPTFFPPPSAKTDLFRQRYHILHQRVLRAEPFQRTTTANHPSSALKITTVASLLGRSGSSHLLLGLLSISPTGTLTLGDLTGAISLDLSHAAPLDTSLAQHGIEPWLCPGMIVLVDGVYEEEFSSAGGSAVLGGMGGIGGTIGGRFVGLSVGAPRCETRTATLGITTTGGARGGSAGAAELHIGGGFGWVDFLGVGSERGVGSRMRRIEQRVMHSTASSSTTANFLSDPLSQLSLPTTHRAPLHSNKLVILGDVNLDQPSTLSALRKVLQTYSPSSTSLSTTTPPPPPPLSIILLGPFVSRPAMSATTTSRSPAHGAAIPDSITYKEHFDALAALLSDFPYLLRNCTWVFVPGDNDPWAAGFSAGAAVPLPRGGIPDMFTSRVRRAFAAANAEVRAAGGAEGRDGAEGRVPGEAVWTTNPSRLTLFGPNHEVVLFRDDVSGRLRRNAISLKNGGGMGGAEGAGMEGVGMEGEEAQVQGTARDGSVTATTAAAMSGQVDTNPDDNDNPTATQDANGDLSPSTHPMDVDLPLTTNTTTNPPHPKKPPHQPPSPNP